MDLVKRFKKEYGYDTPFFVYKEDEDNDRWIGVIAEVRRSEKIYVLTLEVAPDENTIIHWGEAAMALRTWEKKEVEN